MMRCLLTMQANHVGRVRKRRSQKPQPGQTAPTGAVQGSALLQHRLAIQARMWRRVRAQVGTGEEPRVHEHCRKAWQT